MIATESTTSKLELRLKQITSEDTGKKYYLVIRKSDNMAIDCQCLDRQKRGRKSNKDCKHMKAHNTRVINTRRVLEGLAEWMNGLSAVLQSPASNIVEEAIAVVEKIEVHANDLHTYDVITVASQVAAHASVNYDELMGICQGCCKLYRPEQKEQVFCRRCS